MRQSTRDKNSVFLELLYTVKQKQTLIKMASEWIMVFYYMFHFLFLPQLQHHISQVASEQLVVDESRLCSYSSPL